MPEVLLAFSEKRRRTTWNPVLRAQNVLAEKSDTNRFNGVDHIARPGLTLFAEVGFGPIRGVFRQEGTFSGNFLVASGAQWFRVNETGGIIPLGSLPGTLKTITAATATRAITASNNAAWSTNGFTVTPVVMPDSRPVSSVAQINGYFVFTEGVNQTARVYYIPPGETNPDGLDFFSTESIPGANLRVERVGDELWFFKREGIEVWVPSGDADLPFQRVPGRNYDKGVRNKDTVARFDNSVAWVGNDGIVYRADNTPVRISDHAIEEEIRKADKTTLSAWTFSIDGHTLYCLNTSRGTFAFDASSQQWSVFTSYGQEDWKVQSGDAGDTFTVCGDATSNKLYVIDPEVFTDDGEPIVRVVTGGVPVAKGVMRCNSLEVYVTTGTIADPSATPEMRVSWSDDLQTYSDWEDVSVGQTGQYGVPVRLDCLGSMSYPGRLFQFTMTEPCAMTLSAAAFNEPAR